LNACPALYLKYKMDNPTKIVSLQFYLIAKFVKL